MKRVFADAQFWIATVNRHDPWSASAKAAYQKLGGGTELVTTQEVLVEYFNGLCSHQLRTVALHGFHAMLADSSVEVVAQTYESFMRGFELFRQRMDKEYSLTDCISMQTMRERGLTEVLTHDHHFTQEGFEVLMQ
jgi:predicted nucleic acid-binding protein